MIIVTGSITAREGRFDEALALSREHVARSRGEPGCLSHAVHLDADHPRRLVFFEEWSDMAALQEHFAVPASRAFAQGVAALAEEPPRLKLYEAVELRR